MLRTLELDHSYLGSNRTQEACAHSALLYRSFATSSTILSWNSKLNILCLKLSLLE